MGSQWSRLSVEEKATIVRLRSLGMAYESIALKVGRDVATVYFVLNPEAYARKKALERERALRNRRG